MNMTNVNPSVELSMQLIQYSFVFVAFFITLIAYSARDYAARSRKASQGRRELPPGPRGWPIIGHLGKMIMNRPVHRWIMRYMKDMQTEIACFCFAGVHVITISSDKIAREALKEKDAVLSDRPESYSGSILSGGFKTVIFSHYGAQWKKMRRVMTSELMSPGRLSWLLNARTVEADNLLAYVHNIYQSRKLVNVRDIARTYCYAVMMRMMFGRRHIKEATEDGSMGPMEKDHVDAIFNALDYIFSFRTSDYITCLRGWHLDSHEKKAKEASDTIDKYNELIINERIELWRETEGREAVGDWLDIFISLRDAEGNPLLTPEEIKGECKDICLATLDNPSNVLEWTFAEMLNRPETLKKAMDELNKVVGRDRLVQESDIPNLNYIKSCCRESFRLHPVAPFLPPHIAMEDTSLAGYFIPKGSHVLVNRVALGRNPNIWEEPDVFMPDRHIKDNRTSQEVSLLEPDMMFVSFGTGRRGCVGGKLGTYMTVMLMARLLQGFTWSLPPGSSRVELVDSEANLLMAKPLMVSVEPRLDQHMYPKFQN